MHALGGGRRAIVNAIAAPSSAIRCWRACLALQITLVLTQRGLFVCIRPAGLRLANASVLSNDRACDAITQAAA